MTTPRYRTDVAGRAGLTPLKSAVDITPGESEALDAAQARGDTVAVNRILEAARKRAAGGGTVPCECQHGDAVPALATEEAARQKMHYDSARGRTRTTAHTVPRKKRTHGDAVPALDTEEAARQKMQRDSSHAGGRR